MTIFTAEHILILVVLGFGVGAYGTFIGAGGGFVLMPLLLLLYPKESPEVLTSISLAVVFFNSLSGSEAYALMKRIDYKSGLMFAAATIPGAIVGALTTSHVPRRLFDAVFAAILLVLAGFLLSHPRLGKKRGAEHHAHHPELTRHMVTGNGVDYAYSFNPLLGILLSFFVGFVSGLLGIGGGVIYVPALAYLLDFPVQIAIATSQFTLVIISLTGTVVHIVTGAFSHGVTRTLSLAIGVVLGAELGANLSARIRSDWIIRSLAVALGLVGIRILVLVF